MAHRAPTVCLDGKVLSLYTGKAGSLMYTWQHADTPLQRRHTTQAGFTTISMDAWRAIWQATTNELVDVIPARINRIRKFEWGMYC